jgi:hypothetical protein
MPDAFVKGIWILCTRCTWISGCAKCSLWTLKCPEVDRIVPVTVSYGLVNEGQPFETSGRE